MELRLFIIQIAGFLARHIRRPKNIIIIIIILIIIIISCSNNNNNINIYNGGAYLI